MWVRKFDRPIGGAVESAIDLALNVGFRECRCIWLPYEYRDAINHGCGHRGVGAEVEIDLELFLPKDVADPFSV